MRRQQLHESVGVLASEDWLAECIANVSPDINNTSQVAEEAILEQLLHHDLRDIVEANRPSDAATTLRRAVEQSRQQLVPQSPQQPTDSTVRLPESFRLLVQVENVSNMAVNAEKRLAAPVVEPNGAGLHSSSRCLKLAFSDGYDQGPEARPEFFTAIEVTRIPDLTTHHTVAGVKVLLRGPMTIRNGICGWTAANAIVLGGRVEELVQYQQQALHRERQRVGHGVDPTVKALIWMNDQNGEQQQQQGDDETNEHDESERASGDVDSSPTAAMSQQPPSMYPTTQLYHQQPEPHVAVAPGPGPAAAYPHSTTTTTLENDFMIIPVHEPVRHSHVLPPPAVVAAAAAHPIPRSAQPPPQPTHHHHEQGVSHPSPFPRTVHQEFPVPQSLSPLAHTFNGTTRTAAASAATANPYQRSSSLSGPPRPVSTPPASRSSTTTVAFSSQTSTDSSISSSSTRSTTDNPYQRHASRPAAPPPATDAPTIPPPGLSPSAAATTTTETTAAAVTTRIGFLQLRVLLQQALSDPSRHLPDLLAKTFTVSMNQVGLKLGFNIERKHDGGAKQYEYVMDAKFGGDNQEQMLITCRVTNTVLEPFFSLPPGEMRKLKKTDKARSADLIRDGGKAVTSQLRILASYIVIPIIDGNASTTARPMAVDGPLPILQVLRVA